MNWFWRKEPKKIRATDEFIGLFGPQEWKLFFDEGDMKIFASKDGRILRVEYDEWEYTHYYGALHDNNIEQWMQMEPIHSEWGKAR